MKKICLLILALAFAFAVKGQNVAVKTHLLADAAISPNLGVEIGLAPRWSFEVTGQYNAWPINERTWKHWLVQPEARYWFCEYFTGHFLGIHALGGKYNFGNLKNGISFLGSDLSQLTDHRYEGHGIGVGIAYGYSWILGRHWNLEAEIGVGYIYTRFDTFECQGCKKKIAENQPHHYVGPTKAAINLVYVF